MRTDVELVPARATHVGPIANRMRQADVLEAHAFGLTPRQALRSALLESSLCLTSLVDGRPEAMFGMVVTNALCGVGSPWMLGSDAIYRHPRDMIATGERLVSLMLDSTSRLENVVSVSNTRAIRMLRRWGFSIGEGVIVHAGVEFLPFSMERN